MLNNRDFWSLPSEIITHLVWGVAQKAILQMILMQVQVMPGPETDLQSGELPVFTKYLPEITIAVLK